MKNNIYGLLLDTDFEIRTLRDEASDADILIPLGERTLNIEMEGLPGYLGGRLQSCMAANILIRLSKEKGNASATVHILRSIDLYSAMLNFEIDCSSCSISISDEGYSVLMRIKQSI